MKVEDVHGKEDGRDEREERKKEALYKRNVYLLGRRRKGENDDPDSRLIGE